MPRQKRLHLLGHDLLRAATASLRCDCVLDTTCCK